MDVALTGFRLRRCRRHESWKSAVNFNTSAK